MNRSQKKPTIFLSHSSRDKESLQRLKELFCAKTGGTIDVFLSSDGQSIPLGRNWVHRIQEALEDAAIMVVFVSPNSINSSWVYFEAGFAYAKNIRVVPVGFLGVELGLVKPPLSLLQGFNITNQDGLDNLIALANDEFSHHHSLTFSSDEYQEIIEVGGGIEASPLGEFGPFIDDINVEIEEKDNLICKKEDVMNEAESILKENGVEYSLQEGIIRSFGMSISSSVGTTSSWSTKIMLDPLLFSDNLKYAKEILTRILKEGVIGVPFRINFFRSVDCVTNSNKITSRLARNDLKFGTGNTFILGDLEWELNYSVNMVSFRRFEKGTAYLRVIPQSSEIELGTFRELIELLVDNNLIYVEANSFLQ